MTPIKPIFDHHPRSPEMERFIVLAIRRGWTVSNPGRAPYVLLHYGNAAIYVHSHAARISAKGMVDWVLENVLNTAEYGKSIKVAQYNYRDIEADEIFLRCIECWAAGIEVSIEIDDFVNGELTQFMAG